MHRRLLLAAMFIGPLLGGGCVNVRTDKPIEVHVTVDVNVRVAKALDDFFGDLDKKSATIAPTKP